MNQILHVGKGDKKDDLGEHSLNGSSIIKVVKRGG